MFHDLSKVQHTEIGESSPIKEGLHHKTRRKKLVKIMNISCHGATWTVLAHSTMIIPWSMLNSRTFAFNLGFYRFLRPLSTQKGLLSPVAQLDLLDLRTDRFQGMSQLEIGAEARINTKAPDLKRRPWWWDEATTWVSQPKKLPFCCSKRLYSEWNLGIHTHTHTRCHLDPICMKLSKTCAQTWPNMAQHYNQSTINWPVFLLLCLACLPTLSFAWHHKQDKSAGIILPNWMEQ